ncbi:hypothetical protein KAR91_69435 [Candidatus Pacearchaeota archaeon]|nr:hypothetical protein [Candidatus Pacearchaeota archaeon]
MTEKDIQRALYLNLPTSQRYMAKNICLYNIIGFEMDFISITKKGVITEYEIKTTFADFKADFKKKKKHIMLKNMVYNQPGYYACGIPNYFYYIIPYDLKDKILSLIPDYAGVVMWYGKESSTDVGWVSRIKAPKLHDHIYNQEVIKDKLILSMQARIFK